MNKQYKRNQTIKKTSYLVPFRSYRSLLFQKLF